MATHAFPQLDTGYFFQQLARASNSVLILDFDSTLAQLGGSCTRTPYPSIRELLECMMMIGRTRVVVVSARPQREVASWFGASDLEIWGCSTGAAPAGIEPERTVGPPTEAALISRMQRLSARGPLAYLRGGRSSVPQRSACDVRAQLHVPGLPMIPAIGEDLEQFLLEWLRACASEVC